MENSVLAEAKRHIRALIEMSEDLFPGFIPGCGSYLAAEARKDDARREAQAFLDAEGQTVEGGEGINELRDQIRDLQEEDARGDLGKRLSVLDAKATVWHEISQAADKDEPTEISAMVRVIRELVGYARTLNRGTKRLRAELTRLKAAQDFQQRVDPWLIACFGEEIARDQMERNHRFFEEATELVQANGMTASEAHQLVDYTYGRPVGEASQEVGGVMVTLAALCLASGLDMHAAAETELARIWTKVEKIRAKQAAKPKHSPLPEHVPASSQPEHDRTVRLAITDEMALQGAWGPINEFAERVGLQPFDPRMAPDINEIARVRLILSAALNMATNGTPKEKAGS